MITTTRHRGIVLVKALTDQSARLLGTRVNEPCVLTCGEMFAFLRNAEVDKKWMADIDTPWSVASGSGRANDHRK
jgi:hypothetical protein